MTGAARTDDVAGAERHRHRAVNPVAELRAAICLLTRLPVRAPAGERSGSGAFAAVGAALGLLAAIPPGLFGGAAPLLAAILALAVVEVASGALHLDGLADTADALAAPDPARAEAARTDPRVGSAGVGAIVLVLGSAAAALAALPPWAAVGALAVAGASSRAVPALAAPLLARRGDAAAGVAEPGFGGWFARHAGWPGAIASLLTVALVAAAAAGLAALGGWLGAGAAAALAIGGAAGGLATGLACAWALRRRFGRLAGDFHGASVEIAFAASLAVAALVLAAVA